MAPRSSARSAATRNQASSPPKSSAERQSHSPVARRTRATRSQSADLDNNDAMASKKQSGKRGSRQGSVESIESNASLASSRGTRSRRAATTAIAYPDLSTLPEDDGESKDEEEAEIENIEIIHNERSGSPGAMSQMSGTTAITSHSVGEIAKLDPMMAEILPDLLDSSYKILDLLAPPRVSQQDVENIMRDLKVPGSRRAKHLRHQEERFRSTKVNYGSDNYIRTAFVLRKLLGTDDPGEGNFRPDPVIRAANLATLVTEFLVMQKESQSTRSILEGICTRFPHAFVDSYDEDSPDEHSEALEQSFDVALELNVQYVIAYLARMDEGEEKVTPEQVLVSHFYESVSDDADPDGPFEQLVDGGILRNFLRAGQVHSEEQSAKILDTLRLISNAFRDNNDARDAGDSVDFDQLEINFPWTGFITTIVQWSRLRLTELSITISKQGGIEEITSSLIELIKNNDSQVEIQYDAPASTIRKRELLPAANITSSSRNSFQGSGAVQLLQRMKQQTVDPASSAQAQTVVQASSRTNARSKQASMVPEPQPVRQEIPPERPHQDEDDYRPDLDDGEEYHAEQAPRPTAEYVGSWKANIREGDKENREDRLKAKPPLKRRLIDRQEDAEIVQWNSQDVDDQPSPKRARSEREESVESEDLGFEQDRRQPDPARRNAPRPAARCSVAPTSPLPPRRERVNRRNVSPRIEGSNAAAHRVPKPSARANARRVTTADEEADEMAPAPTFAEVSAVSRAVTTLAKQPTRETQRRVAWSSNDEEMLIAGIEEHGCSWSEIEKQCDFEHPRGQVAIKDKARNMKASFLKAGIPLPENFINVRLGQKELNSVRQVIPGYRQD